MSGEKQPTCQEQQSARALCANASSQHFDPFGPEPPSNRTATRKLCWAIALCGFFMIIEIAGGALSNSLAIITDAAHLLSDITGFLISLLAIRWSTKRASAQLSFGYHRAEILGALLSIAMVWAMTIYLVIEAVKRLLHPEAIDGKLMFKVACLGVLVNVAMGVVLYDQHEHSLGHQHSDEDPSPTSPPAGRSGHGNINVKAAFIHVLGDLIQSVGVMLASLLIWLQPQWTIADPLCTFLFSILVVGSTWMLAKEAIVILMEGTPAHIDSNAILAQLLEIPTIVEVHDLHVWSLGPGKNSATVHVVLDKIGSDDQYETVLRRCQHTLCKYSIHHATIQIDSRRHPALPHCRENCCGSTENFMEAASV